MAYRLQVRRDTASNWTSVNPVLEDGEEGYETDTKKTKRGDGTTAWTSLSYWNAGAGDVSGPASSTDNTIPRFDGTGGKTLQGSALEIDDNNELDMNSNGINSATTITFNSEYDEGTQTSPQTVSFGDSNPSQKKKLTLNSSAFTLTLTFPAVGNYVLKTVNNIAVTSLSIAVTGGVPYYPGATIDFKGSSSAINLLSIYYDGTDAYVTSITDMSTTAESVNIT